MDEDERVGGAEIDGEVVGEEPGDGIEKHPTVLPRL
jgi:hypothetical protein